jgi:succinoglycan biosynthesis transport protein ExoP
MRSPILRRRPDRAVTRSEVFRVVRTNLEVLVSELEVATVAITSAHAGEGKTATCAQLARALADSGRRVVVVDFDLRDPDLHNWFGLGNEVGASDVLTGHATIEDALQRVELPPVRGAEPTGMYVLAAGRPVPDHTELLGSRRTASMIDSLASQADVLLLDTPPVLPVADTLVIARMVAGAVLVLDRDTPVNEAKAAKDALVRNHARVLGVVLNRFDSRQGGHEYGDGYPAAGG